MAERKPGSYPAHLAQVANLVEMTAPELEVVLGATEVGEVWGVAPRIGQQLKDAGVHTVLDLTRLDPAMVRSRSSVILERTVRELQARPALTWTRRPRPNRRLPAPAPLGIRSPSCITWLKP
jgi:DNA polymerase V